MKFANILNLFKPGLNRSEVAALRISLLIAAVDGNVCREELLEFARMNDASDGCTAEEITKTFEATLHAAGYLLLLAKIADEKELLEAFVREAEQILPVIMDFGPTGIDDAVAVWTKMAKADGVYSEIERKAIATLERMLNARSGAQTFQFSGGRIPGGPIF